MSRVADGRRLSESVGCEIAGVTPAKRRAWIKRGVLTHADAKAGLSELQIVELALVNLFHGLLGPGDAAVVWREAGEAIKDAILVERIDLVVDTAWRQCHLVSSDAALAEIVASGRQIRVIPLAPLVKQTREAFRRLAAANDPPASRGRRGSGRRAKGGRG
jgi:hypothetical protein